MMLFVPLLSSDSFAHQSGCHRWHSCPSHTGSYECGDTGHDSQCGNNDNKEDDDNKQKKDNKNKKDSSEELSGRVTKVIDGDTLVVDDVTIRLSLVNTPESDQKGYQSAKNFVKDLCLGEKAKVDIDDGQPKDSYGRTVGLVYCDGVNLNQKLMDNDLANILTKYCSKSEFDNENWADC